MLYRLPAVLKASIVFVVEGERLISGRLWELERQLRQLMVAEI
jgi:hypothetical protein